jgi:uncharacterized surface protein with fasciclin (FAS1) repeats
MRKEFFSVLVLLAGFLFLTSCNKDDDNGDQQMQNIVEIAVDNPNLSSLVAAVQRAGLVNTLSGEGTFTVFAPTNQAFETFLNANGFSSVDDVPVDILTQVLLNHVLADRVASTEITTGYVNTLATFGASGPNLSAYVNTASGVNINGVSNVTAADISATNGIIHVVDAVIGLPTITTMALANANLDILVEALTRSDLSANYAEVLAGDGPFTVFAPVNDAFVSLLGELGAGSLGDVPAEVLEATLLYHVVGGANVRAENLTNGQQVSTLQTGSFTIDLTDGPAIIDANGRRANIVFTNVQTANGVVHVIDRVILPGS